MTHVQRIACAVECAARSWGMGVYASVCVGRAPFAFATSRLCAGSGIVSRVGSCGGFRRQVSATFARLSATERLARRAARRRVLAVSRGGRTHLRVCLRVPVAAPGANMVDTVAAVRRRRFKHLNLCTRPRARVARRRPLRCGRLRASRVRYPHTRLDLSRARVLGGACTARRADRGAVRESAGEGATLAELRGSC